jgi:hypothetical protein
MQQTYPTKWQLGKPGGSVKEQIKRSRYRVNFTDEFDKNKQKNTMFTFSKYGSKENAKAAAEKYLAEESSRLGRTDNEIRYINANTIEVKLTNGIIMTTDAKFLNEVNDENNKLEAKKDDQTGKYKVIYKYCNSFANLLTGYHNVVFKNGDSLDLRESNMEEYGTIKKKVDIDDDIINKQYDYYTAKTMSELPKNVWLLGKPHGTCYEKNNAWHVEITDAGTTFYKTFAINKIHGLNMKASDAAEKWRIETSYKLGLTDRLIRIIDDNTIEVKINENTIMKTDKIFIPFIQSLNNLFQKDNAIAFKVKQKDYNYHNVITNFYPIYHLDGNWLNNCLSNLTIFDGSVKGKSKGINRSINKTNSYESWDVNMIIDGVRLRKCFNIKDFGEDGAKERAKKFRDDIYDLSNVNVIIKDDIDKRLVEIKIKKIEKIIKLLRRNICFDKEKYLEDFKLSSKTRERIHMYYFLNCMTKYNECKQKISNLKQALRTYLKL